MTCSQFQKTISCSERMLIIWYNYCCGAAVYLDADSRVYEHEKRKLLCTCRSCVLHTYITVRYILIAGTPPAAIYLRLCLRHLVLLNGPKYIGSVRCRDRRSIRSYYLEHCLPTMAQILSMLHGCVFEVGWRAKDICAQACLLYVVHDFSQQDHAGVGVTPIQACKHSSIETNIYPNSVACVPELVRNDGQLSEKPRLHGLREAVKFTSPRLSDRLKFRIDAEWILTRIFCQLEFES
jgi:hypothetical protein